MIFLDLFFSEWLSSLNIKFFEESFVKIIVMYFSPPPSFSISESNFEDLLLSFYDYTKKFLKMLQMSADF